MKIVKSAIKVMAVDKDGTKVGEVYTLIDASIDKPAVHFRCQGGFVNLASGSYSPYESCREDACWIHQPTAELHLNN
jgi:hypothetical protein